LLLPVHIIKKFTKIDYHGRLNLLCTRGHRFGLLQKTEIDKKDIEKEPTVQSKE
jgi:hypothetical protein